MQATTEDKVSEFVENKLQGLNATLEQIVSTRQMLQAAITSLEQVEREMEFMVGNPLTLSYGYTGSIGNGNGTCTEIVMSRSCTLAEAIWTLVHMYGVDRTSIRVADSMFNRDMNSKVKAIEKHDSWREVEYIISL